MQQSVSSDKDSNKIDWPGSWFPIMKRLGESTEMVFVRVSKNEPLEWRVLQHEECDGMTAMNQLLHGPHAKAEDLVTLRNRKPPGGFALALALFRYAVLVYSQKTTWKNYDPTQVGCAPLMAWTSFDRKTTEELTAFVRQEKLSVNTLLLLALDRAARQVFVSGGKTRWAMPVNMRGVPGVNENSRNQFSSVHLILTDKTRLKELHSQIRLRFKQGSHWANWALMHIGKHVGLAKAEAHMTKSYQKPRPCTGGFSCLGEWNSSVLHGDEYWVGFATVAKISPIGAGNYMLNGRLIISAQIHPSLRPTESQLKSLMDFWVEEIETLSSLTMNSPNITLAKDSDWKNSRK